MFPPPVPLQAGVPVESDNVAAPPRRRGKFLFLLGGRLRTRIQIIEVVLDAINIARRNLFILDRGLDSGFDFGNRAFVLL